MRTYRIYGADRGAFALACGHAFGSVTQAKSNALPMPWSVSTNGRPGTQEVPS